MNSKNIIEEMERKYPGKVVIPDPQENPTEIICEIEPTSAHPEKSVALAVVGASKSHYHKKSTEIYEVIKGTLKVFKNGIEHTLHPGEKITIEPGIVHSAEGNETWFLTYSEPGWTLEDHIIVDTVSAQK